MAKRRRRRRDKNKLSEEEMAILKKEAIEKKAMEKARREKEMLEKEMLEKELIEKALLDKETMEKKFEKEGIDLRYEELVRCLQKGTPMDKKLFFVDPQEPIEDNPYFFYPGYQYLVIDDDTEESEEDESEEEPIKTDSEDCLCSDNSDFEEIHVLSKTAKFMQEVYKIVLDNLVRDFCESLCFDVHRSLSLNYFDATYARRYDFSSESEEEHKEPTFDDIFGFRKGRILYPLTECEVCKTKVDTGRFLQHLMRCMGGGRKCTRGRAGKIDYSFGTRKKRKKEHKVKKKKRKSKLSRSLRKSYIFPAPAETMNYEDLTYDEMQFFFDWHCGVITEITGFICQRSIKCNIHTKDEKKDIRRKELRRCKAAKEKPISAS